MDDPCYIPWETTNTNTKCNWISYGQTNQSVHRHMKAFHMVTNFMYILCFRRAAHWMIIELLYLKPIFVNCCTLIQVPDNTLLAYWYKIITHSTELFRRLKHTLMYNWRPRWVWHRSNFTDHWQHKPPVLKISCGVVCMILGLAVLTQYQAWHTYRQDTWQRYIAR